jgi:hypothetical protein
MRLKHASDRTTLLRLASTLPKGSQERRDLLTVLKNATTPEGRKAWGERLRGATQKEYRQALRNAPHARKEHVDGGKRSMDVIWKDRGTTVARKTILYKRGKVDQELYSVNPDYLPGGDESARGW